MHTELSLLNRLSKKQEELYHRCARASGLTDTQFWLLYALCETESALCQNVFCECWCYSKQTVSTAVAGLERAGLVRLDYTAGSRKQKDIVLTDAGQEFCNAHIRVLMQAEQHALLQLTPAERSTFLELLQRLLAGLEQEL